MKHKLNLFLLSTILLQILCLKMIAQPLCGTELNEKQIKYFEETQSIRQNTNISLFSSNDDFVTFQVVAHIVRDANGNGGLTNEDLKQAMQDVNVAYEPVNFNFEICNINYIDNGSYFDRIDYPGTDEIDMASANRIQNKINIFFVPNIFYYGRGACGWAYYPSSNNDWILMANNCSTNGSTLAHEIGHYFNLDHTFETRRGVELVNDPDCETTGDGICDTPADPTGLCLDPALPCETTSPKYQISLCTDYNTCEFSHSNTQQGCNFRDSEGDLYVPDPTNVMSYNYKHCRTHFSPQQIERMQRSSEYDRDYLLHKCEISCDNMLTVYDWLKEEVDCIDNATSDITLYKYNSVFNYIDLKKGNERTLYLSNGDVFCTGANADACIVDLGLTEILAECSIECGEACMDVNACNYGADEMCTYNCYGCTDASACNYNENATINDNSCIYEATNYDCDGNCKIDKDCLGVCGGSATVDCENVCGGSARLNTSCDDGDPQTTDDIYNNDCECIGIPIQLSGCDAIFSGYPWLSNTAACDENKITVFKFNSSWEFIQVQSKNENNLYLSDGTEYCANQPVEDCIEYFGLETVLTECASTEDNKQNGCTDEKAVNYNPAATCDDSSCIYNQCNDPNACNFGQNEDCTYGNAECDNPCDLNTCPTVACEAIFEEYTWLSGLVPCNEDEIKIYKHNSGWNFIEVKSVNNSWLYLSDGTLYCTDNQVFACKESFELIEPIDGCFCEREEETCNYTGTIFYQDCGGTTFRFIETDDGKIFDPYFELVEQQAYEGDRIKFDFITNDEETPCDVAEQAISLTCIEIIDLEVPEPNCNNYSGTIFYQDCGGTTFRFIETEEGQIFDPYFDRVNLNIYDGQKVKFDFVDKEDVVTPCDVSEKPITITCIEEIEVISEGCDDVFTSFPWLLNKVNPENCSDEEITVYAEGNYYFIYINTIGSGDFFLDYNGVTNYGQDNGDYYLPAAYDFNEVAKWTCGCSIGNTFNKTTPIITDKEVDIRNNTSKLKPGFEVYPNPTKGKVVIRTRGTVAGEIHTISIFDLSGKQIYSAQSQSESVVELNLSKFKKGIYLIKVSNTQNTLNTHTQKLILE